MGMHTTKVAVGEGIRAIVACMDERALQSIGNAFDFCYLDTTSYDEFRKEDLCCIQISVVLAMWHNLTRQVTGLAPCLFAWRGGLAIVFDLLA